MIKLSNILLLGLIGFGGYYFYRKNQESLIAEDTSSKGEKEQKATTSVGVNKGGGVPKKEPKLEAKEINLSEVGGVKLNTSTLLQNLAKSKKNSILPTIDMNNQKVVDLTSKTTFTNPKLNNKLSTSFSVSKFNLPKNTRFTTMSNFYGFFGDDMDDTNFSID